MGNKDTEVGYFDLPRLSIYSSLGVGTLRDHIRSGGLPHYKPKGKILVKRSEFDNWLTQFRVHNRLEAVVDGVVSSLKGYKSDGQSEGHKT